ncbi:MAG: prepilin-type N-terminal cleavage/methylation domain-containing protein [Gemmataceae bacterium]|nr:prepilin-type N-terminal cleavage/methylation domain-containing protein [Gemmataceae bacterium]
MKARPGYTLLEVLLALGIATLLLAGLYVSMDVQLRLAQAGRDKIDDAAVARALINRITQDVAGALTPIRASETATGGGGSGSTTTTTTSTTTSTTDTETATNLNAVTPLNGGVIGDGGRLILYVSRPPGAHRGASDADATPNGGPDLRRIVWWLADDGGLARQEIARVTADDEGSRLPPDVDNVEAFLLAAEVASLQFQFFDGAAWVDTWDGTAAGDDGATPVGPPRAVKVILGIRSAANRDVIKNYQHVVAIQSANAQPMSSTVAGETP